MPTPRVTCIIGMHRSGTSMVARIVNLLGVDLGPDDRLLATKPDNPTGFWEAGGITAFNDDLLAQLGGRWDEPAVLRDEWEHDASLDPWRERARRVLESHFGDGDHIGWKDPRMSLLLPFWRTVTPIDDVIVVLRDPAEVAASLRTRGDDPAVGADHLWLRYVVAALRAAPDALVVTYDELFDDRAAVVAELATAIGRPRPDPSLAAAIEGFVDDELRHRIDHEGTGLAHLVDAAVRARLPGLSALFGALHDGWSAAQRADELAERVRRSTAEVADLMAQRDRALASLTSERADLLAQRDRAVASLESERADLLAQRDRAVAEIDALRAALTLQRNTQ